MHRPFLTLIMLAGLALLGSGCSPESKKLRHLHSADTYYTAGEYDKAEVEYLNALKIDPLEGRAIGRLGMIYTAQGRTVRGIAFLMRGRDLLPEDLDLRLKAGQFYQASGKLEDARKEATFILDRNPRDPEAPALWVATMANPNEADLLRKRLQDLPAPASAGAPVLVALAMLELRLGHLPEAGALLQKAQSADATFPALYSALAALHLAQKNVPQATLDFQHAATLSPPRSPRILQYAQFKMRLGDLAGGREILLDMTRKTPDYVPAWVALAEMNLAENKLPECTAALDKALTKDPENLEAQILRGKVYSAKGEYAEAITQFEKLAVRYPRMALIQQELGRAYGLAGEVSKGISSLSQALAFSPNAPEAVMLLARLNSRKGDNNAAIALLRKLVEQRPDVTQARMMLADAYRAQGDFASALTLYQELEKLAPQNVQTPLMRGIVLAQQGRNTEAFTAFERAFELTPDSPVALEQLVNLYLREKKYQAATERVEAVKNPKLTGYIQLLLAKIFMAKDDRENAELHLKKAIELMPDSPTAYFLLAGIYNRTNQYEKALGRLNEVIARNPKETTALLLASVIQDQLGNYDAAKDGYEKLLALNPNSVVSLNNLAYLYSEKFKNLDKALELAQKARQLLPNEASSTDTLGWIFYKKHQYPRALALLHDAAEKSPADGEIQFHLGLTEYMMGEEDAARTALQRALQINPDAKWQAEARQALSILAIEGNVVDPGARSALDKALAERPDDPVALTRIATLLEREGKPDLAIGTLEAALKINSQSVNVLLNLARLHGAAKHSAEAMDYAKAARKLAPEDPGVAHSLGRLAYQNGDFQWSFSLLQEAERKLPDSPELQFDLALACYSIGRLANTETALRQALNLAKAQRLTLFSHADEARQLLDLMALAEKPAEAAVQSVRIDQILQADPTSVPGLMVAGTISEQRNALDAARQFYEKALTRFPDFVPAKHRLALLGETLSVFDQKIYDWALQIRPVYPTDAILAKTLGIQTYLKGDNARALALLKESLASRGDDPVTLYYLGLAQAKLKDPGAAKSLQQSIDLGLKGESLGEARKILSEKK